MENKENKAQKPSYCGFLIDMTGQYLLLEYFNSLGLEGWVPKCHHITLNMGALPEDVKHLKGEEFTFDIIGFGISDKACCVKVNLVSEQNFKFTSSFQHVTLGVNIPFGKAFHSNFCVIEDLKIGSELLSIKLKTTLCEFSAESVSI